MTGVSGGDGNRVRGTWSSVTTSQLATPQTTDQFFLLRDLKSSTDVQANSNGVLNANVMF
jgi:hypothetical protein